jgi:hypothetical protein
MNAVCWYESQKQYQLEDHVLNREISGQKQLDSNISHISTYFSPVPTDVIFHWSFCLYESNFLRQSYGPL